jgi:hypothetical protein
MAESITRQRVGDEEHNKVLKQLQSTLDENQNLFQSQIDELQKARQKISLTYVIEKCSQPSSYRVSYVFKG